MNVAVLNRRIIATGVALAGVVGALTLAASPATAASPGGGGALRCAVNLETGRSACAADDAAAARLAGVGPQSVAAVRLWDGFGFTGASKTFYVGAPCTPAYDTEYAFPNLGVYGWNNRASSVETFNRCDVHLHDGYNYTGAVSTWIDRSGDLRAIGSGWNNRASSIGIS
jgi:hypothetical protein